MTLKKFKQIGRTACILWFSAAKVSGQDLLFDQASGATNEIVTQGHQIPDIPTAQSFTPSFSAVGFVQFQTFALDDNNGAGVLVAVNLREGAYNGPVVSSTAPIVMVRGPLQIETFYFPDNIPVGPGQLYFFEPTLLSPGSIDIGDKSPSGYLGGDLWSNGVRNSTVDLWFREGTVVPEPSAVVVLCLGAGIAGTFLRRRRHRN